MDVVGAPLPSGCSCGVSAKHHNKGNNLVLVEDGRITSVVSLPPAKRHGAQQQDDDQIRPSGTCCQKSGVAQALVQLGETTEDVLLEMCMEEACCILPMAALDAAGFLPLAPSLVNDHEHRDGCGHKQVVHGDHSDWLIPLDDGSYLLSHAKASDQGSPQLVEHGRLVKVGELKKKPSLQDGLFSFRSPERNGYTRLIQEEDVASREQGLKNCDINVKLPHTALHPAVTEKPPFPQGGMVYVNVSQDEENIPLKKTVLNVMAICCPAEDKLIRSLLEPLPGIQTVSVNFTAKTAAVLHDPLLISDVQLVKLLNEANLDASIKQRGELKTGSKWPSPWIVLSAILMAVSLFQFLYSPLKWIALGSVAIGLLPMLRRSMSALRRFILDINVLMAISVVGATALGDYLEAGGISFLFAVAMWLESRSVDKARTALASVLSLAPQFAVLLDTGAKVAVEEVKIGTLLAVRAGELIPIDGVVVDGKSCVDESSLTGESTPVEKEPDSIVWAGTLNMSGYLSIRTSALAEDSAVAKMVKLVEEAQSARSRTEQYVDKFAKYYTPAVVAVAVIVAVIPAAVGVHNVRHWVYLSLVILVGACPCALVVSTPVTTTCGLARAAKAGLLIKGGSFLEALGSMKCIAMDKTGTLTEGHFRVLDVKPVDRHLDLQKLLYWMAAVENKASHPMGAAIVAYARLHGVEPADDVTSFDLVPGEGVSAVVDGRLVRIGNLRLASRLGWHEDPVAAPLLDEWRTKEATLGWIGVEQELVGVFCVGDEVRPEAARAVANLKAAGVTVTMLTGDSEVTAQAVRRQIGEMGVHAELLPADKVRWVEEMKGRGVTGMLGDGINDAPALATANIGIAMGVAGSAIALETADVALMTNDLTKIAAAVLFGQACRRTIRQNIGLSLVTKAVVLGLAFAGYAALWAAVLADVGTCLLVIFNGMRLLSWSGFKQTRSNDAPKQGVGLRHVRPWLVRTGLVQASTSSQQKRGVCEKECCSPKSTSGDRPALPCCSFDEEMGGMVCQNSAGSQVRRRLASKEANSLGFQLASSASPVPAVPAQMPSCSKGCCGSRSLPPAESLEKLADTTTSCAAGCCWEKLPQASFPAKDEPYTGGLSPSDAVQKCSKGCCGDREEEAKKEAPALPQVPAMMKDANSCGTPRTCGTPTSSKCCGPPPVPVQPEIPAAASSCVKGCCNQANSSSGQDPKPVANRQLAGPCLDPVPVSLAPVPGSTKTCSKKCCGGTVAKKEAPALPQASAMINDANSCGTSRTCSSKCCGLPPVPVQPEMPAAASSCVKGCCNQPNSSSGQDPKPVVNRQLAEPCLDPVPVSLAPVRGRQLAGPCLDPVPVSLAPVPGITKTCSKKCCGGIVAKKEAPALPQVPARIEDAKSCGTSRICSSKCCGLPPVPVQPEMPAAASSCPKGCCKQINSSSGQDPEPAANRQLAGPCLDTVPVSLAPVPGSAKTCSKKCCGGTVQRGPQST